MTGTTKTKVLRIRHVIIYGIPMLRAAACSVVGVWRMPPPACLGAMIRVISVACHRLSPSQLRRGCGECHLSPGAVHACRSPVCTWMRRMPLHLSVSMVCAPHPVHCHLPHSHRCLSLPIVPAPCHEMVCCSSVVQSDGGWLRAARPSLEL